MKKMKLNEKSNNKGVLCLGFFDCVHIGHISLIEKAKSKNQDVFVFTFDNDISCTLSHKNGFIYNLDERLSRLKKEGVKGVLTASFDENFMKKSKEQFLIELTNTLDITEIVCGEDYRFGFKGEGDVKFLKEFFADKQIKINSVDLINFNDKKASTTYAKEFLQKGDLPLLNEILGDDYRMTFYKKGENFFENKFLEHKIYLPKGEYLAYYFENDRKINVEIKSHEYGAFSFQEHCLTSQIEIYFIERTAR